MIKKVYAVLLTIYFLAGCAAPKAYRDTYEYPKIKPKMRTIIIDPGHGGRIAGARGPRGSEEKGVVLDISKRLARLLKARGHYKSLLTRTGDYDVPLDERRRMAQENGADLFISIHCDGNVNRSWNGTAVYILSEKGDCAAKERTFTSGDFLVNSKNANSNQNYKKNKTLIDLLQAGTGQESYVFAKLSVNALARELRTKNLGVKGANFAVLRTLDVPSVLVEVAFLSNWWEERLLKRSSARQRVAKSLYRSIEEYFRGIND